MPWPRSRAGLAGRFDALLCVRADPLGEHLERSSLGQLLSRPAASARAETSPVTLATSAAAVCTERSSGYRFTSVSTLDFTSVRIPLIAGRRQSGLEKTRHRCLVQLARVDQ